MATKEKIKHGNVEYTYVFKSIHKFARLSPFKARYIMDAIRFKPVNEALTLLKFTNRRSATFVDKVLRSAIANAIDFGERKTVTIPVESLMVKTAIADEGPRLKRWRARSKGIANPIIKRSSHLLIEVGLPKKDAEELEKTDEISGKIKDTKDELDKIKDKIGDEVEETTEETEAAEETETTEETTETDEAKAEAPETDEAHETVEKTDEAEADEPIEEENKVKKVKKTAKPGKNSKEKKDK
ncbi:MAG: 50S ribosomal protein L22 [Planctomycetes bacterium]|nr:50S ribosomal protein L22 [Planctomycetota bacterium]